jgi:hypothetical protein
MQGLRERNQNIIRQQHKRSEKEKPKPVAVPSHAPSHVRTPPKRPEEFVEETKGSNRKVGLDEEEMLFLARRCLAEELMSRPNVPAVLAEMNAPVGSSTTSSSAEPLVSTSSQPRSQTVEHTVDAVARPAIPRRNRLFQLQRLGVGLVVLKFGWIWVSCGGFIVADSLFCTTDICVLIYRRMREHVWQIGTRLHDASRESIKLFTETDD